MAEEDFVEPGIVLQLGVEPRRIDILTAIDGVEFEEAWEAREEIEIEGISVYVIDKVHLAKNKEATGRAKDQIDLDWLRRHAGNQ